MHTTRTSCRTTANGCSSIETTPVSDPANSTWSAHRPTTSTPRTANAPSSSTPTATTYSSGPTGHCYEISPNTTRSVPTSDSLRAHPEPRTNFAAGWTLCTAETATSCGGLSAEWRTSPNLSPAHGTGDVKVTLSGVCPVRSGRCRVRRQPSAAAGSGRCGRERLKLLQASEAVGADFAARRPDRS